MCGQSVPVAQTTTSTPAGSPWGTFTVETCATCGKPKPCAYIIHHDPCQCNPGKTTYRWVVDEYCDQIKIKTEKQAAETWIDGKTPRWSHVFTDEAAARTFIVYRASQRVERAKQQLKREEERKRRVIAKFSN